MKEPEYDLFGNKIERDVLLRDKFIEPPFSVLDTKNGNWQERKRNWKAVGILGEVKNKPQGQNTSLRAGDCDYLRNNKKNKSDYISIFDPALCELLYHWFCPSGGKILDPFAGGSVRGIVANYLGYKYTGIDIREEQIESNREQGVDILPANNQPNWYCGDSMFALDDFDKGFDFVFSCPPYANLEKYSDLAGDISNMEYDDFLYHYGCIIEKACALLKDGGLACFVVGEVRDKSGNYIGLVPDTIEVFKAAGMDFYNDAVLLNPVASASMRAKGNMKTQKLVKIHQNVLVFKKPK